MSEVKKVKILFWSSFACEAVVSATFLWMPFIGENRIGQVTTGIIFWLFLICGYVCMGIANYFRKAYNPKTQWVALNIKRRIGLLHFFSNIPAAIFDMVFIVTLLIAVVTAFTKLKETYLPYLLISLILLSLNAHCMFNGRIYIFVNFKLIEGEENHGKS